jgi:hypothetical protein
VYGLQAFAGLELDDDLVCYHQVEAIPAVQLLAFVVDGEGFFPFIRDASKIQLTFRSQAEQF